jgi:hypothetical protein
MSNGNSPFLLLAILAAVGLMVLPRAFARAAAPSPITHAIPPDQSTTVRSVFDRYNQIQRALAQDSMEGVAESASAIARTVRNSPTSTLPSRVADRADRLARAKNLTQARDAFLRLSPPLTAYAKKTQLPGFYEGYCRMHRAYWLQAGQTVNNPYCGKDVTRCGRIREFNGAWIF